jgi:hypothetical protein
MRARSKPRAAEPDAVDAAHRVRAVHYRERRHVARRARQAAHDRQAADAHVLVHDAVPRDERVVVHDDVPGDERAARDDDARPEAAVVGDVRVDHHEVRVAEHRVRVGLRAAVHLAVLPEDVPVADADPARRVAVGHVLRRVAEDGPGMHDVVGAEVRVAEEHDVRHQTRPRSRRARGPR